MQFDVRVNITGLCLLVPDPATDADPQPAVHALLAEHGEGADQHFQVLAARVTRKNHDIDPLLCVELTDLSLTIGATGGSTTQAGLFGTTGILLPSRIVDVRAFAGVETRVSRASLGPTPGAPVASRVTLLAGTFGGTSPSSRWHGVDEPTPGGDCERGQQMTTAASWLLTASRAAEFTFAWLRNAEGPPPSLDLQDVSTISQLELWIYNATRAELTGGPQDRPKKNDPVKHFEGYFDLLGVKSTGKRLPRLVEDPATLFVRPTGCFPKTDSDKKGARRASSIILTAETSQCVLGQSEPDGR
jgi:hypothetical protein